MRAALDQRHDHLVQLVSAPTNVNRLLALSGTRGICWSREPTHCIGVGLICRWNFTKDARSNRRSSKPSANRFRHHEAIDPEMRGIVERNWPHLVSKLPPEDIDE
jgi:hypothetical protein